MTNCNPDTPAEIRLDTIADFAALTPEQFKRMLPDFVTWHAVHTHIKPFGLQAIGFSWRDDGRTGEITSATLIDPTSGETIEWKEGEHE